VSVNAGRHILRELGFTTSRAGDEMHGVALSVTATARTFSGQARWSAT
jgi:hypothetical protein